MDNNQISVKKKDVCIVVAGNVDSGKSTFIGVLVSGKLDNGRGSARETIMRHKHEINSGKTSDISVKHIGTDDTDITLVDLCGHEKYLKTTLFGITGYFPDHALLIVSANNGFQKMTKEHLGIILYLKIPFTILVTRTDITPKKVYKTLLNNINKILKRFKKEPIFVNGFNDEEIDKDKSMIYNGKLAKDIKANPNIVPVISMSCKTGYFVNEIKHFITSLDPRDTWNDPPPGSIFYIDSKYTPPGIGLVITGILKGDTIKNGSDILIGPYNKGFKRVKIWSMHNNIKEPVQELENKSRGCLAVRPIDGKRDVVKNNVRRGMIATTIENMDKICYEFKANIEVLKHSTVIATNYMPVIHCGTIKQTAQITLEDNQKLKVGSKALVKFRFAKHPEFIETGSVFFFREGTTRGFGVVTDIIPADGMTKYEVKNGKYIKIKKK